MCLGAIYWARPKVVYYACTREDAAAIDFDDQLIYDEIDAGIDNRQIPFRQMQRSEALNVFNAWQDKTDKIEY